MGHVVIPGLRFRADGTSRVQSAARAAVPKVVLGPGDRRPGEASSGVAPAAWSPGYVAELVAPGNQVGAFRLVAGE